MTGTTIKYKSVDLTKISIEAPMKVSSGKYSSNILYDSQELNIQTPILEVKNSSTVKFKLVNRGQFFTLLDHLRELLIEKIYNNSALFFNGKEFSEKRLRDSFEKIVDAENDHVIINNISTSASVKILDNLNEIVENQEFPVDCSCIINVGPVIFDKKSIRLVVKITHMKIDYNLLKKKDTECILEFASERDIVKDEIIQVPEIENPDLSDPLDVIVDTNTDELDFFN